MINRFTTCLDSGKSGLCVNKDRFREDQVAWGYPLPDCMQKGKDYVENRRALQPASHNFVLDVLMRKGREIWNQHLKKYEENKEKVYFGVDPDLSAPIAHAIEQMEHQNQAVYNELIKLVEHVKKVHHAWLSTWRKYKTSQQTMIWSKATKSANRFAADQQIDMLRNEFASNPGPDEIGILLALDPCLVSKLKASIAVSVSGESKNGFAIAMAYETLLKIKAEASGSVSPIARSFGDILGVSPAIGRFYSQ